MATKKTERVIYTAPAENPNGCTCNWSVALVGYGEPGCSVNHPMTWVAPMEVGDDQGNGNENRGSIQEF